MRTHQNLLPQHVSSTIIEEQWRNLKLEVHVEKIVTDGAETIAIGRL